MNLRWRRPPLRERLRHVRYGLAHGYPWCCIARYAVGLGAGQARLRGIRYTRDGRPFVPCLLLHGAHRPFRVHDGAFLERDTMAL